MEEEKPRYTHDCTGCIFLGLWANFDLYYCKGSSPIRTTVIARYGDKGPEYASGLEVARTGKMPELAAALKRAIGRGFVAGRASDFYEQSLHLYIDKIRGLMQFVGEPRPPLFQYREAMEIVQEEIARNCQSMVGSICSPQLFVATITIAKNAINLAHHRTGFEIGFEHEMLSPGDYDDLGFTVNTPKTAYDVLREAQLKREGK